MAQMQVRSVRLSRPPASSTCSSPFTAPFVATLPADVIHSVVNPGDAPSAAIHVYFGDLTTVERSIWSADLREERRFDSRFYVEQARALE